MSLPCPRRWQLEDGRARTPVPPLMEEKGTFFFLRSCLWVKMDSGHHCRKSNFAIRRIRIPGLPPEYRKPTLGIKNWADAGTRLAISFFVSSHILHHDPLMPSTGGKFESSRSRSCPATYRNTPPPTDDQGCRQRIAQRGAEPSPAGHAIDSLMGEVLGDSIKNNAAVFDVRALEAETDELHVSISEYIRLFRAQIVTGTKQRCNASRSARG
jgi:hypothetical protein